MKELNQVPSANLPIPQDDRYPWPHDDQTFQLDLIVTGGWKWELEYRFNPVTLPPEVHNVISDTGFGIGDPVFDLAQFPQRAGRYMIELKYFEEDNVDWESGVNDPDYGFNVVSVERQGFMSAIGRALFGPVKAVALWWQKTWPWGYLCDFHWEGQGRIRLTKNGWVIVGGEKEGDATDALPVTFVSPACVERIVEEMNKKWYAPKNVAP